MHSYFNTLFVNCPPGVFSAIISPKKLKPIIPFDWSRLSNCYDSYLRKLENTFEQIYIYIVEILIKIRWKLAGIEVRKINEKFYQFRESNSGKFRELV